VLSCNSTELRIGYSRDARVEEMEYVVSPPDHTSKCEVLAPMS
jgi:hypothetical protein